jgi:ATP/maltotriose-dependent transcriptional regulator MalT/DNA-binding SARP family transcriptional activator
MPVILSKVRLPQRRPRILKRVRLLDMLHQNIHRKLNFISAPAGYGKTTIMVDFANDVDAEVCWYHIGFDDTDLVSFFKHVIAAFHQNFTDFGKGLGDLISSGAGLSAPRSLASELVNEIQDQIDDFCVLVLDDYHLVDSISPIVDFIEAFLEFMPDQLRIIIGSRSIYGVPTATLFIREDVSTIGAEELRFQADELQTLTRQHYRFKLNDEQANELVNISEGWIVAILLAIRGKKPNISLPKIKGATDQVFTFLAEEVINTLPDDVKSFMLSTSILDEFNEDICNNILDTCDSELMLGEIEGRNLFVTRIETKEGISYRYHQLFAEFLKGQLKETQADRLGELHCRAAEWYYDHQEWRLAIHHKLAGEDYTEAAKWMDQVAEHFYIIGQRNLISNWYEILAREKDLVASAPILLLYYSKMLFDEGDLAKAEDLLNIAEPVFQRLKQHAHLANLLVSRGGIRRCQNNFGDAIKLADKAQKQIERNKVDRYQWYQAERLKGFSLYLSGEIDQAIDHLNTAVREFRRLMTSSEEYLFSKFAHDLIMTLTDMGFIFISECRIFEAQTAFLEAMQVSKKVRVNQGDLAMTGNNLAYLYYQLGQYREAWRIYDQALEAAFTAQYNQTIVNILDGRGDLLRDIDEWILAEESYNQAIQLGMGGENEFWLGNTFLGLAELERLRQNFNESLHFIREAARVRSDPIESPKYRIHMASVYLSMGQVELAVEELTQVLNGGHEFDGTEQEQILATFLLAHGNYLLGDRQNAEMLLKRVLSGAARLGYDQFLVVYGRRAKAFIDDARKTVSSPQFNSLCKRINEFKSGLGHFHGPETQAESPDLVLEIQGFGPSLVRRNGKMIPNSAWKSSRARALFFYILDHQKVRKEDIALEFWPDFSTARVSSNFHTTLWRVRKALGGSEVIAYDDDFYYFRPEVSVWYDVAEFERLVGKAKSTDISIQERVNLWRETVELYHGEFLDDLFMDWIDFRRLSLREAYLTTILNLAISEFNLARYVEAKDLCNRAIRIDPYRDDIHLLMMKCFVESGSPSAAKAHYQSYRSHLHDELNIEPAQDLQDYYITFQK